MTWTKIIETLVLYKKTFPFTWVGSSSDATGANAMLFHRYL